MKTTRVILGTGASLLTGAMLLGTENATAQQQNAASAILEEIVVTARRREESLEDLPLSVVAISAEAMQAQGIYTTDQIGEFAANVTLAQSDRMNHSRIFIRGIGGGFPNPIAVFGTGMYIDGHYLPGSLANYMSTVDIERVEVLRGPQGTLFGKNVTGGAVNIISTKPNPDFASSITLRLGDYGQQDFRGMLNTPITDNLFFRGSVSSEQFDGYWDNIFLGKEGTDYRDSKNFRGALRWLPNDNWTIDAAYQKGRDRNGQLGRQCKPLIPQSVLDGLAAGGTYKGVDWPGVDVSGYSATPERSDTSYPDSVSQWGGSPTSDPPGPPGGHVNRLAPITTAGQTVTTNGRDSVTTMWDWCYAQDAAGDYTMASEKDSFANADIDAVFVTAAWNSDGPVGGLDNLEIRANVSWRDSRFNWIIDRDYTPLPIDVLGHVDEGDGTHITTRGLELVFDMDVNDRLNLLFGLYSFDELSRTGDGDCWSKWSQMFETYDATRDPLGVDGIAGTEDDNRIVPAERRAGDPEGLGIDVFGPDTQCGPGSGGNGDHGGLIFEFLPDRELSGGPGSAFQNVNLLNESTAAFAHMTYEINDTWTLEAGARWTEDVRDFNITEFEAGPAALFNGQPYNTRHFLGQGICQPTPVLNYNNVVLEGFFNQEKATFSEVTPMISLTRNLTSGDTLDEGMIYALYSEGFLTGSFNDELNVFLTPALKPLVTYNPEHVANYELGFKGTFAGGRVRLNADVFLMDYTDKQEPINLDNAAGLYGPDPSIELTQNAGSVNIYGIEAELRASPWDGGFLTVDASYLKNEYKDFLVDDVENPGQKRDLSQRQINDRTPDWTLQVSVGHTFTLGNGASLTPQLGMYAQGEYDWLASTGFPPNLDDPPSVCNQSSYEKFRARVTYEPAAGNWEASLYGSNITDERILEECDYARTGVYDYRWAAPSAWGLEFVARFGEN